MPKAIARRLSSLPTRPMPMTPSVLLLSSTPSNSFRFQWPPRMLASACGILRATLSRSENACSAVETVFPPGAFRTTTPRRVAVSTSTLSTPTPARPMTRSRVAALRILDVTLVSLRTISAAKWPIRSTISFSLSPVLTTTSSELSRASSSIPRGAIESAIKILGGVTQVFLSEDEQLDRFGQLLGDVGGDAAAKELSHGGALRGADNEKVDAESGGEIENGCDRVLAHRVERQNGNTAFAAKLEHGRHDGGGLRIIVPLQASWRGRPARVKDGNLLYIEHIQSGVAQLCFIQSETEHAGDAARRDQDLVAFFHARLYR